MRDDMNHSVTVFTAGYAGKSAREFFELLRRAGVRKVIDVRLYNTSQLAGYAKRDDLAYFLQTIVGAEYVHMKQLSPTKTILDDFKKGLMSWEQYEAAFHELIVSRRIETIMRPEEVEKACFLCAEARADHCHRRLVAEYLAKCWGDVDVAHL